MIKVEVIEKFTLKKFNELKNVKRGVGNPDNKGTLSVKDTFECDEKMAQYLLGDNPLKKQVVKLLEIQPEKPKVAIKDVTVEVTKEKNKKKKGKK